EQASRLSPPVQAKAPLTFIHHPPSTIHRSISGGVLRGAPVVERTHSLMKNRIRLLLVDDHPIVRKGIAACLARHPHLEIVGEAILRARELTPDIVLMDIDMPHMNGLTVTEQLRKEMPQLKVLILSMHSHTEYVLRILQSGARGYVLKDASPEDLVRAIETV